MATTGSDTDWTRLVAGVAAHDIANAAQALGALLEADQDEGRREPGAAAAAEPGRYRTLARERLGQLRRLAADLRALARGADFREPQRIDLACTDALAEVDARPGQVVVTAPLPEDTLARGSAAALRVTIRALVDHALHASPPGATVRVSVARDPPPAVPSPAVATATVATVVTIDAPRAPAPALGVRETLGAFLAGDGTNSRGDARLVIAGALSAQLGAELWVAPGDNGGGLRLSLRLPG